MDVVLLTRGARRLALGLTIAAVLLLPLTTTGGEGATIGELLGNPARYDNRSVTVVGTAGAWGRLRVKTSETSAVSFRGFSLTDDRGASVWITSVGPVTPGARVEITGVYRAAWRVIESTSPATLK